MPLLSLLCTTVLFRITGRWLRILKSLNLAEQTIDRKAVIHLWLAVLSAGYGNGGGGAGGCGGDLCKCRLTLEGSKEGRGVLQDHWNCACKLRPQERSIWDFFPYTMEEKLSWLCTTECTKCTTNMADLFGYSSLDVQ